MVIHGGIDIETNKLLSDIWVMNLVGYSWTPLEQFTPSDKKDIYTNKITGSMPLGALAYHSCCIVIASDRLNHKNFDLYKSYEVPNNRSLYNKVKIEGVYFFGGVDEYGINYNNVKILRIGRKPCEWVTPKIDGTPPKARNSASMIYYEDMNLIIIYGGKNLSNSSAQYFKDLWVLDLEKMIWFEAKVESSIDDKIKRANHACELKGNKMIIFGGINESNYAGADTYFVNCDLVARYEEKQTEKKNNIQAAKDEYLKKAQKSKILKKK